ncbi:MAG: CPBP family intramembrane glutamic endopeptidase, partial [Candidatus Korarchaeota archaeon]
QTMSRRVASLGVVAVLVSMFLAFLIGELIYSFEFASFYYEISELFWFVVFVALILQLVHRSKELIPFAIENDKEKTLTDLKSALLVSLAITPPVVLLIMRENYFYQITTDPSNLAISLPRNFVLMFFLVALPEEYAFRYVLQGSLRTLFQKKSPSVSITIASLFFGIIHIPLFIDEGIAIALTVPFVYQGIIGALYGIFWHRTDSLLGAVLIHAWFDMLIFAV